MSFKLRVPRSLPLQQQEEGCQAAITATLVRQWLSLRRYRYYATTLSRQNWYEYGHKRSS